MEGGEWGMGVCDGVRSEGVEGGGEGVSVLLAHRGGGGGEGSESGRREGSASERGGRGEGDGVPGGMKEEEEDECPRCLLEMLSVWKREGLLGARADEMEGGGEMLIPSTPDPPLSRRGAPRDRVRCCRAAIGRAEAVLVRYLMSVRPAGVALHRDRRPVCGGREGRRY